MKKIIYILSNISRSSLSYFILYNLISVVKSGFLPMNNKMFQQILTFN